MHTALVPSFASTVFLASMDGNDGELLVKNSDNVFASVVLIADNATTSFLWFQDSLVKQSLFRYEHYLESLLIEPKKQYSC